jgi:hypothetical protein
MFQALDPLFQSLDLGPNEVLEVRKASVSGCKPLVHKIAQVVNALVKMLEVAVLKVETHHVAEHHYCQSGPKL